MGSDGPKYPSGGTGLLRAPHRVRLIQKEDRKMEQPDKICEKSATEYEYAIWYEKFRTEDPKMFHRLSHMILRMTFSAFCAGILAGVILAFLVWEVIL
jgi:hypothetical protein